MRIPPEERSRLLSESRYRELLELFPPPAGTHAENVLIVHLPKMTDEVFKLFKNFLSQQLSVENGATLHSEPVARLASWIVNPANLEKFRIAIQWAKMQQAGLATPKWSGKRGCSGPSQTFWHILRTGRVRTTK